GADKKGFRAVLEHCVSRRDVLGPPNFERHHLQSEARRRHPDLAHLPMAPAASLLAITANWRSVGNTSRSSSSRFDARSGPCGQASDVATGTRQTGDEAGGNRVRRHGKYDRDVRCRLLCGNDGSGSGRDDDIDVEPDQLGCDLGEALSASSCPAIFDRDRAALDPPELAQPLRKGGGPSSYS